MEQDRRRIMLVLAIVFLLIISCGIPAGISPPVPNSDPGSLSTIIAGTAMSAATQTASGLIDPGIQQPSTETPVPAATNTPEISNAGTSLVELADGSTRFTDHPAGIQLLVPAGWLSLRTNEAEYYKAWESPRVSDPAFTNELAAYQNLDAAIFRLHALDVRPDHVVHGEITNINVVFQKDDLRSLEEAAADEERPEPYPDYKLISSGFQQTAAGLQIFVSEKQWAGLSSTDEQYITYYKSVTLKLPSGLVALDLFAPLDFKDIVLADFDQFVASLVLIQ